MSDADDFDEDTGEEQPKSKGNTLRDQNSKLTEKNAELQAQLNSLLQKDRSRTIADVLRDKGANPKLAKYATRDLEGDVTADAVTKWLEEEGELFGYRPDADAEDDEVAVQQDRISRATDSAPQPKTGMTPERMKQMSDKELVEAGYLEPK